MRALWAVLSAFLVGVVLGGLGTYKDSQIAREMPKRDGSRPPIPRRVQRKRDSDVAGF